jgi:hypothetical protein
VDPRVPPARLVQAAQASPAQRSAAAGMVPPQYRGNELGFVQRALEQATKIDQAIAMGGLGGIKLDEAKATADSYRQAAYKVMDALAPTTAMREAVASGQATPLDYSTEEARRKAEIASAQPTEPARLARDQGLAGGPLEYERRKAAQTAQIAAQQHEEQKTSDTLEKLTQKGIDAKTHSAKLEAVDTLGQKVGYGVIPKIQSYLGAHGINTAGLSDIQAYERAIDFLAPQLRPEGSGRLMQSELTAFKAALGGLMTTPQGRKISVQNLKLVSDFDQKVGDIARDASLAPAERTAKIYALAPPKLQTTLLPVGAIRVGEGNIKYRFNGGNPNDQASWSPTSTAQQVQRFRGGGP